MEKKYKKHRNGSYMHNCLIIRRHEHDDPLTELFNYYENYGVTAALNGYAIIPLYDYYKMKNIQSKYESFKISNADKELHDTK